LEAGVDDRGPYSVTCVAASLISNPDDCEAGKALGYVDVEEYWLCGNAVRDRRSDAKQAIGHEGTSGWGEASVGFAVRTGAAQVRPTVNAVRRLVVGPDLGGLHRRPRMLEEPNHLTVGPKHQRYLPRLSLQMGQQSGW
jgi:hypothetical protein